MKNIHVLPTEKPSRLWINNLLQGKLELSKKVLVGSNTAQHIYITNDEQIKEGDWYLTKHKEVYKSKVVGTDNNGFHFCKKIILTTDQDLIKNGIQVIDDEFLEWFVKNPSCEEVEIVKYDGYLYFKYMVIIPQEEPTEEAKQRAANYMRLKGALEPKQETILEQIDQNNPVTRGSTALVYKQETLEEAAERLYPFALGGIGNIEVDKKNHFIKGAEYQATQMYGEEEVLTILKSHKEFIVKELKGLSSFKNEKEWFEQFKKK
jgi:hypothetical protein